MKNVSLYVNSYTHPKTNMIHHLKMYFLLKMGFSNVMLVFRGVNSKPLQKKNWCLQPSIIGLAFAICFPAQGIQALPRPLMSTKGFLHQNVGNRHFTWTQDTCFRCPQKGAANRLGAWKVHPGKKITAGSHSNGGSKDDLPFQLGDF